MPTALRKGLKISVIIGIIAVVAGLFLPNFAAVREKARRVNDLGNLNAIWKIISQWGLTPSNSGILLSLDHSGMPLSLDQLVKNKIITADMLINHETGKPSEYYPAGDLSSDGNHVILVSRGKHGMNVVKVAGQGMWVDYGTPEAAELDCQLATQKKQQVEILFGAEQPPMPQSESLKPRHKGQGIKATPSTNDK